jgi:hypothetical protein
MPYCVVRIPTPLNRIRVLLPTSRGVESALLELQIPIEQTSGALLILVHVRSDNALEMGRLILCPVPAVLHPLRSL